jgi:hypothetical protein
MAKSLTPEETKTLCYLSHLTNNIEKAKKKLKLVQEIALSEDEETKKSHQKKECRRASKIVEAH